MSSHTTNSNSKRHVNNKTEINSLRPIQSTQRRLSSTNQCALNVTDRTTYSTRSYTHNNATRSSAQSNINQSNIHRFNSGGHRYIEFMKNIDFRRSQSNGIGSRAYMSHCVRRTLSGLSAEEWDRYSAKYPTQNHLPKVHPNVQYSQIHPRWYRIVSIGVNEEEANASLSYTQPQKFQSTTHGRYNTAGIDNSQSDVSWYRKINRDVIESQKPILSSWSERLECITESQDLTPPPKSSQARSTRSWPASSMDSIHQPGSHIEPTSSTNESEGYQSANVIHTTVPIRQHQNLSSNQSPAVSISINSERSATQNTPSINMNNYPNRGQLLINISDFSAEDQSLIASSISSSAGRHGPVIRNIIGIIPTPQTDSTGGIVEPEILEVIIYSTDNPDYSIVLADPNIIRMHKILQRRILTSNSSIRTLYQQLNDYMQIIRNIILSRDNHSLSVSYLMGASLLRMVTMDEFEFPEEASKMPPITTVDRIKNGIYDLLLLILYILKYFTISRCSR